MYKKKHYNKDYNIIFKYNIIFIDNNIYYFDYIRLYILSLLFIIIYYDIDLYLCVLKINTKNDYQKIKNIKLT